MTILDLLHFGDLTSICSGGSGKESINWKNSEFCVCFRCCGCGHSEQLHHPGVQLPANTS